MTDGTEGTGRHGKKISAFLAQTSYQNGDLINIVRNGTNFKIDASALAAFLGVTGTIAQIPNSDAPFLEQPSTAVNKIRGLEAGKGTIPSLTARNNVKVDHNFVNGAGGVNVIKDITSLQTVFRSFIAGTGIGVALSGDSIQISSVTAPVSTKTVVVDVEADFPAPVGGVITLDSNIDYLLVNDISTSNRYVVANNSVIRASNSAIVKFTYTGTETFFTGVDTNFKIEKIKPTCPNGTVFDMSGTVPGAVFQMNDMTVESCDKIGTLNNLSAVQITNTAFDDVKTDGMSFIGNIPVFILERCIFTQLAGDVMDLGTATFDGITLVTNFALISAGVNFVKGATGSANINTGGLGTIFNSRISGAGSSLSGLTTDDALWNFLGNDDIADTRADGLLSMQSNTTNTVIAIASIPVLVAGTWVVETTSQMSGTTAGKLTYNGGKNAKVPITASVTLSPVSGGSQIMGALIALNGTPIDNSIVIGEVSAGSEISLTAVWQLNLANDDEVEVFVTNISGTTDVLVTGAILRVN